MDVLRESYFLFKIFRGRLMMCCVHVSHVWNCRRNSLICVCMVLLTVRMHGLIVHRKCYLPCACAQCYGSKKYYCPCARTGLCT